MLFLCPTKSNTYYNASSVTVKLWRPSTLLFRVLCCQGVMQSLTMVEKQAITISHEIIQNLRNGMCRCPPQGAIRKVPPRASYLRGRQSAPFVAPSKVEEPEERVPLLGSLPLLFQRLQFNRILKLSACCKVSYECLQKCAERLQRNPLFE